MEESLIKLFDKYKVVIFVPQSYKRHFLQKLTERKVNQIGQYINCISCTEVEGMYTPTAKANPYIGAKTVPQIIGEVKIEFLVSRDDIHSLIEYIKQIHPYEGPEIDVIPLLQF